MKNENLYDKLNNYKDSDFIPFHMPGHKRNYERFNMPDVAGIDITEIDDFDDYHYPQGIIREIEDKAADIYGSDKSYYLVNGSSCGILIAVSAACRRGGDIIVARNCHKAVYNAITLNDLTPHYIYPQINEATGIIGEVTPQMVENMICDIHSESLNEVNSACSNNSNHKVSALVITSPTYEGTVSDIKSIAKICHEHGIILIVDEAHGAHFNYNRAFPKTAMECGADIVIESLHKTLPCYTQTAIMHINGDLVDCDKIKYFLSIYQTSSPSYIFMAGINKCIDYMVSDEGILRNEEYVSELKKLRGELKNLNNISLYEDRTAFDFDISKLVLTVKNKGVWLYDKLLNEYHIQPEMASSDYIILMTSIGDKLSWYEHLISALKDIDEELNTDKENYKEISLSNDTMPKAKIATSPSKAINAPKDSRQKVKFTEATGRISLEWMYAYPPGIPLIYPGEEITEELIKKVNQIKNTGVVLKGMADENGEYIVCLK